MDQDIAHLCGVQLGLHSRGFESARYSEVETRLQVFHAEAQLYLDGLK